MKDWNQLKKDCCPLCSYRLKECVDLNPLYPNVKAVRWKCEDPSCDFTIGDEKKRSIIASLGPGMFPVGRTRGGGVRDEVEENLAALNNF